MPCMQLAIKNLTVSLDPPAGRTLVDNVSLTLGGGSVLAVVGESGAGKSMTSLAVMGLLPPGVSMTGGDILLNETSIVHMDREARRAVRNRDIAMIMQNPMSAFDPLFTIGSHFHETLAAHDLAHGGWRRLAMQALREVGLEDALLESYPFQLSGGMLQRVMIAIALITSPSFLIADEATTDLDVVSQARVLAILKERQKERSLGMLVVTHDLGVAAALADAVAVMWRGRVVEVGDATELFSNPGHPYTKQLLDAHHTLYSEKFFTLRQAFAKAGA